MVSLTVAATGKSPLFKGSPISLNITEPVEVATVADVKAALAAKLPWVRSSWVDTRVFLSPLIHGTRFCSSTSNGRSSRSRVKPRPSMTMPSWPPLAFVTEANWR